jgi:hypothetical protein
MIFEPSVAIVEGSCIGHPAKPAIRYTRSRRQRSIFGGINNTSDGDQETCSLAGSRGVELVKVGCGASVSFP